MAAGSGGGRGHSRPFRSRVLPAAVDVGGAGDAVAAADRGVVAAVAGEGAVGGAGARRSLPAITAPLVQF